MRWMSETSEKPPKTRPARRRMSEQWEDYSKRVLRSDAGFAQRMETRRAFYAGAAAIQSVVMKSLSPGAETTDEDLDVMQDLHLELEEFARVVREGRA